MTVNGSFFAQTTKQMLYGRKDYTKIVETFKCLRDICKSYADFDTKQHTNCIKLQVAYKNKHRKWPYKRYF